MAVSQKAQSQGIPSGAVPCMSHGKCGESLGWHYANSAAYKRCASISAAASSGAEKMRNAAPASDARAAAERRGLRPLRRMEADEEELLEAMRQTALKYLPFYTHMMYRVKAFAVDEEPQINPETGEREYHSRAAITNDWRLLINFQWVREEFENAYERYGDSTRAYLDERGYKDYTDEDVRQASDMMANIAMSKVLLHEMGHAMYDTWDYVEKNHLNPGTFNAAEDCVINNSLRVLGSLSGSTMDNSNIHGEFIEAAVYGGSVQCDDPDHSWHYTDPKTGKSESRCNYDQSTMHYYERIQKMNEDQQQSSSGNDNNESEQQRGGGDSNSGSQKGSPGGSDRDREDNAEKSADSSDGDGSGSGSEQESDQQDDGQGGGGGQEDQDASEGSEGSGSQQGGKGDPGDPTSKSGCGRDMAEKYKDDPLGKGGTSEGDKESIKDVTGSEMEKWAEENPALAKQAGMGTGSMARRWAEHRRTPDRIKWDSVLKRVVRKTVLSHKRTRDTYSKINRRAQGMRSIRRGTKDGYVPSISAAIDTSGSMSPEDLYAAYNSVHSVIKKTGASSINAFAVDASAQSKPVRIKKAEDLAPILTGGGGTDMCAGIENAYQNGDDVCIVFTDGYVPWGKMEQRPKHIRGMDVVVAVIAENGDTAQRLADDVPSWMQTVKIDKSLLNQEPADKSDTFVG